MKSIYACLFTGGLVKVGIAADVDKRVKSHVTAVAASGGSLMHVKRWESDNAQQAERRIIEWCTKAAKERRLSEWFVGLDFDELCVACQRICSESKPEQTHIQMVAERVVSHFGTQTRVAHALGYRDLRNVAPWTTGKRWFPPKQCVLLEQKSKGALPRQVLRPHDYAEHWPELA